MKKKQNSNKHSNKSNMVGWECGKCGSVYSPFVTECPTCKNSNIRVVTSPSTIPSVYFGDPIPGSCTTDILRSKL